MVERRDDRRSSEHVLIEESHMILISKESQIHNKDDTMELCVHVLRNKKFFHYNLLPLRGKLTLAFSSWLL